MDIVRVFTTPIESMNLIWSGPWPPPETLEFNGVTYERRQFSKLSDDAADHPNIGRGAVYRVPGDMDDRT